MKQRIKLLIALAAILCVTGFMALADNCQHTQTKDVEGPRTDYDEHNWIQEMYEVCTSCGTVVDTYYNGGSSADITIPSCKHPNATVEEGPRTDYSNGRWEQEMYKICPDCGEIETYYVAGIVDTIPTRKPCDHSKTSFNVSSEYYKMDDANTHTRYQEGQLICTLCSYVINSDYSSFSVYSHTFNSNGKCTACGYQRAASQCTHTETQNVYGDVSFSAEGSAGHQKWQYYTAKCVSCGKVTWDGSVGKGIEAHIYNNNGKCKVCGYQQNTCSHRENQKETLRTEYKQISGNARQHYVINHNKVTCTECGKVLKSDEVEQLVGGHSFDSNGRCFSCGYEKADCTHNSTNKKYVGDATYVDVDAEQHYKIRLYNLVCSKCKEIVETNARDEELQKHSLDNKGACRYCTYSDIAKCKHWNTTEKVIERQSYRDLNGTEHRVYGLGTKTCKECGVVVEENVEVDEKEYHTYDMDGFCIYCNRQIEILEHGVLTSTTTACLVPKEGGSYYRQPQGWLIGDWTASSNVDWITINTNGGKSGDYCPYTVAANTGEARTGYIIIDCGYAGNMYFVVIQEGSREATVKMHPTLTGFSVTPTTVNLGDSITVSGIVSGNGAKLTAVSVGVRNYSNQDLGGYWGHQTSLYDDTFDLSSFGPIALSGEFGNTDFESGQWIVEVYATTEDGLGFATSHSKIITVHNRQSSTEEATPEVPDEEQPSEEMSDETDEETVTICEHQRQHLLANDITTYNQIVDNSSDHQVETHYSLLCSDCNEIINPDYVEVKNEKHTFVNGVCLCGATQQPVEDIPVEQPNATCNHIYGYNYADVSEGEWQSVNDDYHKRVTVLYKDVCTLCGDVRYERRADEASVQEKHIWGKTNWAKYHSDENAHWRIGKCPCTALCCDYVDNVFDPRTAHTFVNGKCVCGYEFEYDCNLEGHIDEDNDRLCDMCLSYLAFSNRLNFRMENDNPALSMVYMQLMETGIFDSKYIVGYSQYVQGLEAVGSLSIKKWIEANPNLLKFHSINMNEKHTKEIVAKLYVDYIANFDVGDALEKTTDDEQLKILEAVDRYIPGLKSFITAIKNSEIVSEVLLNAPEYATADELATLFADTAAYVKDVEGVTKFLKNAKALFGKSKVDISSIKSLVKNTYVNSQSLQKFAKSTALSTGLNVAAETIDVVIARSQAKIVRERLAQDIGGFDHLPADMQAEIIEVLDTMESELMNALEIGTTAVDSVASAALKKAILACPLLKIAHGTLSVYTATTNYDQVGAGLEDIYAIKIMTERASEAFELAFDAYQQNPTSENYKEFVKQKNTYRSYLTVGAATYRDWCISEAPSEFDVDFWNHDEKTKNRISEANLVYENELRKIDSYFSLFD